MKTLAVRWMLAPTIAISLAGFAETGFREAQTQSAATAAKPAEIAVADAPIPMRVLMQSPAETDTELQVICLFRSDPSNSLRGALVETNEKLKGLLEQIRKPDLFRGELGETLLLTPPAESLRAKRLLIIGLGDSESFTPDRMELVGAILYREAERLGVAHPFFAPTILDGGVTKYTTGQVSEQVITGLLRAAETRKLLAGRGVSSGRPVDDLTYLAGPKFAQETKRGIDAAVAANARK